MQCVHTRTTVIALRSNERHDKIVSRHDILCDDQPPLHISGRRGRPQLTHTFFFFHSAKAFDKLYLSALHFLLYLRFTGTNLWRRKSKRKGLTVVRNPSASPSSTSFAIVLTWSQVIVLSQALDNVHMAIFHSRGPPEKRHALKASSQLSAKQPQLTMLVVKGV